jgi:hypothetical protein
MFINIDFEWGASEAPGGRRVRFYVKTVLGNGPSADCSVNSIQKTLASNLCFKTSYRDFIYANVRFMLRQLKLCKNMRNVKDRWKTYPVFDSTKITECFPRILRNPNVHYRAHNSSSSVSILC